MNKFQTLSGSRIFFSGPKDTEHQNVAVGSASWTFFFLGPTRQKETAPKRVKQHKVHTKNGENGSEHALGDRPSHHHPGHHQFTFMRVTTPHKLSRVALAWHLASSSTPYGVTACLSPCCWRAAWCGHSCLLVKVAQKRVCCARVQTMF